MPIDPETRARLMDLMEERRLELGLTWREVVDRAGMSYEAIRNFRTGTGGMRELTRRKLSEALGWDRGMIGRVLAGETGAAPAARDGQRRYDDPHLQAIWDDGRLPEDVRLGMIRLAQKALRQPGESRPPNGGAA